MQPSKSIQISYIINPPTDVSSDLAKQKSHQFEVSTSGTESSSEKTAFYGELRKAIEAARNEVGDELTRWRDVVGKSELTKEPKKDAEEEEGEEEV